MPQTIAWQIERDSNYVEAIFWIVIGILFALRTASLMPALSRRAYIAAITFVLFGISDVIEAQSFSGAWWRPWWLLIWKGICVVILAVLAFLYFNERRRTHGTRNLGAQDKE